MPSYHSFYRYKFLFHITGHLGKKVMFSHCFCVRVKLGIRLGLDTAGVVEVKLRR